MIVSLWVTGSLQAQSYLLFMKNRHHEVLYEKGDVISFRLKGDKQKITGEIEGFEEHMIVFRYFKVAPSEISHLYLDDTNKVLWFMKYKYQRVFLISGIGYLLLDTINHGEPDSNTFLVSGALVSAGLLCKWMFGYRIPIKGKRKLQVIEL
ncbi:MAG: hypothetical protein AB7K37_05520 [Cyclobacteriaceae bacterium]